MAGPSHQLHAMRRMVVIILHASRPSSPREFAGLELLIVTASAFDLGTPMRSMTSQMWRWSGGHAADKSPRSITSP